MSNKEKEDLRFLLTIFGFCLVIGVIIGQLFNKPDKRISENGKVINIQMSYGDTLIINDGESTRLITYIEDTTITRTRKDTIISGRESEGFFDFGKPEKDWYYYINSDNRESDNWEIIVEFGEDETGFFDCREQQKGWFFYNEGEIIYIDDTGFVDVGEQQKGWFFYNNYGEKIYIDEK